MVVVNNFYAYKDKNVAGESDITTNMSAESLTVQATDLVGETLELYGATDLVSDDFYKISAITPSFDLVDSIMEDGIYTFPIDGIAKFKFKAGYSLDWDLDEIAEGGEVWILDKVLSPTENFQIILDREHPFYTPGWGNYNGASAGFVAIGVTIYNGEVEMVYKPRVAQKIPVYVSDSGGWREGNEAWRVLVFTTPVTDPDLLSFLTANGSKQPTKVFCKMTKGV